MDPPVIDAIPDEVHAKIPAIVARWLGFIPSTNRVDPSSAADAVRQVYAVADLNSPPSIRWYPSPLAAWKDYRGWLPGIGPCRTHYWSYQLPLTDPSGYWFQSGDRSDPADLAITRTTRTAGRLTERTEI